ncbi:MAG: hypothetical protein CVU77_05440 [Elusimicrobia bacterium HGW-Elusimicrobia-1]|jgi:3D (Asp-Asp-Asp) domain-containing protein|nr:MAG: hypothetical protein CVU77_05440 [Elusimicrobia bacterium HGW-Elusimicrobia-1]
MRIGKKTAAAFVAAFALFAAAEVYYFVSRKTVIIADGARRTVVVSAATVGEALAKKGFAAGSKDIVEPPGDSPLEYPRIIRIIRVTEEIEISSSPPVTKLLARVKSLDNLRPALYKKFRVGTVVTKTKVTRRDGAESSREVISRKQVERIEEYLHLLDKKGRYAVETYNLTVAPKKKMIATAYYPGDPLAWRDGTITYLGMKMQRGIVAVDPRVIPLRTRLWIPGYGYGYAADTGNAIKGNRVDLGVRNPEEEKPWMHRPVTVYILGKFKSF